jgi:septum formation topological specificity factor MinE
MKKQLFLLVVILSMFSEMIFAQAPNWSVNQSDFQYTMTYVGFVNIDGTMLSNPNDKVAAFVNGECRGVANLIFVPNQNRYFAYLTVFSNLSNETVNFKIYDSVKNIFKDISKTRTFVINQHSGNLLQAYSFSSPALSSSAEILDINFKDVVRKSISIEGSKITLFLNPGQNVTALNAILTLSPGATAFIGTDKLTSGSNSINLSNPVQLKILSEDQSVIKEWTLMAQPAAVLSSSAEILDISFKDVVRKSISIEGSKITLAFNPGQNVTALNAILTLSAGATASIGADKLISGSNSINLSNPVQLKVLSEDKTVTKEWTLQVQSAPVLSSSAELLDISFKDVVRKSISIEGSKITLAFNPGQNVTALNAILTLSPGATAFIGTDKLTSGSNSINLTNAVQLKILSEDKTVTKEWLVMTNPLISYFKKNAVCYVGGVIKVMHSKSGEVIFLEGSDTTTLTSKIIEDGQVIFENLKAGKYLVKAIGLTKEIEIIQN